MGGGGGQVFDKIWPGLLVGLLAAAYAMAFPWLMETFGIMGRAVSLLPVCLAAWFWGLKAGLAAAPLNTLLGLVLHRWTGTEFEAPWLALATASALGILLGRLSDLRKQLQGELAERGRMARQLEEHQSRLEEIVEGRTALLVREIQERRAAEKALHQEKERYQLLLETTNEGVLVADAESLRFIYANPAICRMLGYSHEEMLRLAVDRIHPPESLAMIKSVIEAQIQGEKSLGSDLPCLRKDGSVLYADIQSTPVVLEGRQCLMGFFRDVSARWLAEKALAAERERFRVMVEEAPLGVSIIDGSGNYTYLNPKFSELFGYTLDDIPNGARWLESAFPDPELRALASQAWVEDRAAIGPGQVRPRTFEVTCKDGAVKTVNFLPVTLTTGDQFVIYQDLTDRLRAERDRDRTHQLLDYVMDNMAQAMVICDPGLKLAAFNRAFKEIFGLGDEAVYPGVPFENLVRRWSERSGQSPEMLRQELENLRKTGPYMAEMPLCGAGQPRKLMQMYHNPLPEGGFVRTFTDVTERMEAETQRAALEARLRQSHKMEAVGTLASGVAHDFNNILSIISLSTDLALLEAPEGGPLSDKLERVAGACRRGKGLVNQILTFSRQRERKLGEIDAGHLFGETLNLLRAALPASIALEAKLPSRPLRVLADPTELHQILVNLCTNAAHAMRQGGGSLSVGLRGLTLPQPGLGRLEGVPSGQYLELTVSDSGHGMEPPTVERIFEPYFTTKAPGEGTGLGLAMVHGIVESLGGRILVDSRPGAGSTFRVYLPSLDQDGPPDMARAEEPPRGQGNILYVEDEEEILDLGREILTGLGFQVATAADGEEALALARSGPDRFDLVVTDLAMPGLNGLQLAQALKELRPGLPVLLCSGYLDRGLDQELRQSGVREVLGKPFSRADLAKAIKRALG